jgi:hypothetical protein
MRVAFRPFSRRIVSGALVVALAFTPMPPVARAAFLLGLPDLGDAAQVDFSPAQGASSARPSSGKSAPPAAA